MRTQNWRTLGTRSKSGEGEGGAGDAGASSATPAGEGAGTGGEGGSNLPSEKANAANQPNPFAVPENMIEDGKIAGKWNSVEDIIKSADEAAKAYQREKSAQATDAQQAEAQEAQRTVINELVGDFKEAGMQLTPEIESKAVEAGIDIRDVKLTALEVNQKLDAAHSVVGGAEEYQAMIEWGKENMSDAQKKAFDADVTGGMSEYAIRGLHNEYLEKTGQLAGQPRERLRGNQPSAPGGVKGYASQAEMKADLNYISSPQGRNDSAAKARYEQKKRMTSDEVVYGKA